MNRLLLLFISMAFPILASAQEPPVTGSEMQHQTDASVLEITPGARISISNAKYKPNAALSKANATTFSASMQAEFGLNQIFSAGVDLLYGWQWFDYAPSSAISNHHTVGWFDPSIFAKGKLDNVGPGSLRFQLSVAQALKDSTGANNYSGGTAVAPAIGYELYFGAHVVGARFKYKAQTDARNYSPSEDFKYKIKGGNEFSSILFYEFTSERILGLSLEIRSKASSKITADSPGAYDVNLVNGYGRTRDYSNASSSYKLEAYAPVDINPSLRVIPSLAYEALGAYTSTTLASVDGWQIQILARWAF